MLRIKKRKYRERLRNKTETTLMMMMKSKTLKYYHQMILINKKRLKTGMKTITTLSHMRLLFISLMYNLKKIYLLSIM